MEVAGCQENKGEQVSPLKAQAQASYNYFCCFALAKASQKANYRGREIDSMSQREKEQRPVACNSKLQLWVNC